MTDKGCHSFNITCPVLFRLHHVPNSPSWTHSWRGLHLGNPDLQQSFISCGWQRPPFPFYIPKCSPTTMAPRSPKCCTNCCTKCVILQSTVPRTLSKFRLHQATDIVTAYCPALRHLHMLWRKHRLTPVPSSAIHTLCTLSAVRFTLLDETGRYPLPCCSVAFTHLNKEGTIVIDGTIWMLFSRMSR